MQILNKKPILLLAILVFALLSLLTLSIYLQNIFVSNVIFNHNVEKIGFDEQKIKLEKKISTLIKPKHDPYSYSSLKPNKKVHSTENVNYDLFFTDLSLDTYSPPSNIDSNAPNTSEEKFNSVELINISDFDSNNQNYQFINFDRQTQQSDNPKKQVVVKKIISKKQNDFSHIDYWQTVYSIESKQGKLLYRPRNKARNCNFTNGPCGHHQLTFQALEDIGCGTLQCRKDRLDYKKSLELSKKLLALNEKRLKRNGLFNLRGYQKYLIHQQGANGIKNIIKATQGKKELSNEIKKNMANNSPFSYKQLKRMNSKLAAKRFLNYWQRKWLNEKRLIAGFKSKSTDNQINTVFIPTFSDNDIILALNYKF